MEERKEWVVTLDGEEYTWRVDCTGDIVVNTFSTICIREGEEGGFNIIDDEYDKVLAGEFPSVLSAIDYINSHYMYPLNG